MCAVIENNDADLFEGFSQVGTDDIDARDMTPATCGTTASTTLCLEPSSRRPQTQRIRQRSPRKKRNPLDTIAEPIPPTSAITLAVAAVADAAHNDAKPPKPPSEPIASRD
ncbi:hypothetical protein AAVH_41326, partial [Aphelenchoides avenae]